MLRNSTEILAEQRLNELLKDQDCCKCKQCWEDMLAIALNSLPPMYVSTDAGELYARAKAMTRDFDFNVTRELIKAINLVRNNPRHE